MKEEVTRVTYLLEIIISEFQQVMVTKVLYQCMTLARWPPLTRSPHQNKVLSMRLGHIFSVIKEAFGTQSPISPHTFPQMRDLALLVNF